MFHRLLCTKLLEGHRSQSKCNVFHLCIELPFLQKFHHCRLPILPIHFFVYPNEFYVLRFSQVIAFLLSK